MKDLRRKIADLQKNLSPEEVRTLSARAVANLVGWLEKHLPRGGLVGLYRPSDPNRNGEADPMSIRKESAFIETHFAFPRVLDRFHGEMDFAIPISHSDWAKGVYGNFEPRPELPAVDLHDLDVLIVPGVVFGVSGERIGRGGGYYDRYLARATGALRIAFAFDFQLQDDPIPQWEWDARMDVIVTDRRVVETAARTMV